jgi:pyruvate dehydrogenase E1 component alpha subunit
MCSALRHDDSMTCMYRGHGQVPAKGADPARALAEIVGRGSALCCGLGGSMPMAGAGRRAA